MGIASCIIARAEETFQNTLGAELLKRWEIPDGFIARCFVLPGYCDSNYPSEKPIKDGKIRIFEE